jgi:hypothetical protein
MTARRDSRIPERIGNIVGWLVALGVVGLIAVISLGSILAAA